MPPKEAVLRTAKKRIKRQLVSCKVLCRSADDVVEGRVSESQFRKAVVWLTGSRLAGTMLAQLLLVPSALLIVWVARSV